MNRKLVKVPIIFSAALVIVQLVENSLKTDVENIFAFANNGPQPYEDLTVGFADSDVVHERQQQLNLHDTYPVTAVVLQWKRLPAVRRKVLHYIASQHFKLIIIWNNNPQVNLTLTHLRLKNPAAASTVRIINSPINLKDQAKYRACTQATTPVCFYSDDDWDTSTYINSLLASFRADPEVLHTVTEPYTFYSNLVWTYFDASIDLHTGFTWIGCGSVFLRAHAQRHLDLLDRHLVDNQQLTALSDVFFSVWLNEIPSQMNTGIRAQGLGGIGAFSSTLEFDEMCHQSGIDAIRILEHALRVNRSSNTTLAFPRQSRRRLPYSVKSPGLHDDLTFFTNVLPVDIAHIPFDITKDFARGTRDNLPSGVDVDYFTSHSTLHAVDRDAATCWRPRDAVRRDDYFAIDFLRIQTNISFALVIGHDRSLHASLEMRVSLDGLWWVPYRSFRGISIVSNVNGRRYLSKVTYNASQFRDGFRCFRYVMFKGNEAWKIPFSVCDVKLIK